MKSMRLFSGVLAVGAIALAGTFFSPAAAMADDPAKQPDTHKHNDGADHKGHDHGDKDKKKDTKKMSDAKGAKIGEAAPEFTLTDVDGKTHKLSDYKGKIVVLEWFNPECPAILQHHEKAKTFNDMYNDFKGKDVVMIAVNSSAAGKQGAGKELNQKMAKQFGMEYPVALDEDGTVGHAYGATNTPHCFVIDKDGKLAYKGAIDNGKFGKNGDKNYVKQAVEQLLKGETVTTPETAAYGCSVKYADKGQSTKPKK